MSAARVDVREAEMLAVARALVTPDSYASVSATLAGAVELQKIGPSAMRVLSDTLSKGVVKTLARLGGARPRIRPDTGSAKPARVFEVRSAPKLAFGTYAFELIRWLTTMPLGARATITPFETRPATLGDELCAYLALALVEGERLERAVASSPGLRTPLTSLAFARVLARHASNEGVEAVPNLDALVASEDARVVVECLASDLARRWTASAIWPEADVLSAEHALRIVGFERAVLDSFLDAVEKSGRWDLATFVIDAAARVLPPGAKPRDVAARAAPRVLAEGTLRSRAEARQRAGALFRGVARLGKRRDELALVHFIDDGYDVAQAVLASWEVLGREAFARAENVLSTLASLEDLGAAEPAPRA
jgi:FtsH ternary system domain X6